MRKKEEGKKGKKTWGKKQREKKGTKLGQKLYLVGIQPWTLSLEDHYFDHGCLLFFLALFYIETSFSFPHEGNHLKKI